MTTLIAATAAMAHITVVSANKPIASSGVITIGKAASAVALTKQNQGGGQ